MSAGRFLGEATFDEVVFGDGDEAERLSFEAFVSMALSTRVRLLLSKPARFYREGREVPRIQAMRYQ
jgi:hypothetical protein